MTHRGNSPFNQKTKTKPHLSITTLYIYFRFNTDCGYGYGCCTYIYWRDDMEFFKRNKKNKQNNKNKSSYTQKCMPNPFTLPAIPYTRATDKTQHITYRIRENEKDLSDFYSTFKMCHALPLLLLLLPFELFCVCAFVV